MIPVQRLSILSTVLAPPPVPSRPLVSLPLPGPAASEALNLLVRLAARLTKAEGSFLLLNCHDELRVVQSFGASGFVDAPPWEVLEDFALVGKRGLRTVTHTHTDRSGCVVASLAIQHEGQLLGVLGMRRPNPPFFIASQEYVVQAIAFEIAEHLELERRNEFRPKVSVDGPDLIAQLHLLESVVVNANDSILITEAEPVESPGPRIVYANPAFTRTTGYSMEEVLGKSPRLLQGPLTDPDAPARIHAALKAWEPIEVELLNYRKDGTPFWVELSISPVCDEKGWYTHWVSVQRDMTGRKELEALPTASLTRPHLLVATTDPAMRANISGILGLQYEIVNVGHLDEALSAITAFPPELILSDLADSPARNIALLYGLRNNAVTASTPIIFISSESHSGPLLDGIEIEASDYLTKPFSSRELRARVRTQVDLQTLRREVETKEEFIRTTEALRKSEKLALVGRLASSIAHEINNPLETVSNLLFMAESSLGETEAGAFVRQAQAEVARAVNIATQTLGFHRQGATARETLLPEVLEGMLSLFKGRPGAAGILVERQYRTQRTIMAFEADLRQVFANLIGNAMDATSGNGKIIMRVRDAVDYASCSRGVQVLIADNGHGMSEETRKRIFDPFFTTKGSTGTGLGLWVSSEILRNHDATTQVRSSQDAHRHGTVFSIFFPCG